MAEEKRHIFLTGDRQAGKSFLLQRVVTHLGVPLSGFTTAWGPEDGDGRSALILSRADKTACAVTAYRYADRPREVFEEVFETFGAACLEDPHGLVIMDELGRFEASTDIFRRRIFSILDSDVPVFGVVRDMENPFLDAVRNHEKTEVIRVTKENREELFGVVLEKIEDILA